MKLTYNWLKDFINIRLKPQDLADKLTMAGLEVKSIEPKDGDFIFEIEITSNRPDWLSVIGVAREVAALTGVKIKLPVEKIKKGKIRSDSGGSQLNIKIENKKDCPLYTAKIIRGVKVGPSPEWLRKRLELVGCRSINNIVDVTNYILFTFGQPLHAFDLDKFNSDTIVVRRAEKGEKIISIDEVERTLDKDVLVIADREKPVAIAGVMGGKPSEVDLNTKNILLEAAIFDPVLVRRSRRKLGMQTDSSYRFERGVDFGTAVSASSLAAQLIEELSSGKTIVENNSGILRPKEKTVLLDLKYCSRLIGVDIKPVQIKNILNHLGFAVKAQGSSKFMVKVPLFRQDVSSDVDLIEEVSRIYGYDNIPSTLARVFPRVSAVSTRDMACELKNMLFGLGLNEAITYSLIDKDLLKGFSFDKEPVAIMNPLSKDQEILRPIISPSLIKCVASNLNQKQPCVNFFEIASVFLSGQKEGVFEKLILSMVLCGERAALLEKGLIKDTMGLLHLKGILSSCFERMAISDFSFLAAGSFDVTVKIGEEHVGFMKKLDDSVLSAFDIKNKDVVIAEISLEKVFSKASLSRKFAPLPLYPGITRDISFVIKDNIKTEEILQAIKEKSTGLLRQARVVDVYKGKQIPPDSRSLTVSCLYRSDERTLTEEEVNPLHASVSLVLAERFGAKAR